MVASAKIIAVIIIIRLYRILFLLFAIHLFTSSPATGENKHNLLSVVSKCLLYFVKNCIQSLYQGIQNLLGTTHVVNIKLTS